MKKTYLSLLDDLRLLTPKAVAEIASSSQDVLNDMSEQFEEEEYESNILVKNQDESEVKQAEKVLLKEASADKEQEVVVKGEEATLGKAKKEGFIPLVDHLNKEEAQLESIGIYSSNKIQQIEKVKKENKEKNKESSSVFIIKQREKHKKVQEKVKYASAVEKYLEQNADDLVGSEEKFEDKGILINKKSS